MEPYILTEDQWKAVCDTDTPSSSSSKLSGNNSQEPIKTDTFCFDALLVLTCDYRESMKFIFPTTGLDSALIAVTATVLLLAVLIVIVVMVYYRKRSRSPLTERLLPK